MAYCTEAQVIEHCGLSTQVINEAVGTGDGSNKSFSLDHTKVVNVSEKVYVDGTLKTKTTDYTIDNYTGAITFVTAPALNKAVTAHYQYISGDLSFDSTAITNLITEAQAYVEKYTGQMFNTSTAFTEYQDGRAYKDFVRDEDPYEKDQIILTAHPLLTITGVYFLKEDGTTDTTVTKYWSDLEAGILTLKENKIPNGTQNIKVTGTYGSASVPYLVQQLTALLAARMLMLTVTGGSWDSMTSYSLGSKSVTIGEVYVNVREVVKQIDEEIARILPRVGVHTLPTFSGNSNIV